MDILYLVSYSPKPDTIGYPLGLLSSLSLAKEFVEARFQKSNGLLSWVDKDDQWEPSWGSTSILARGHKILYKRALQVWHDDVIALWYYIVPVEVQDKVGVDR